MQPTAVTLVDDGFAVAVAVRKAAIVMCYSYGYLGTWAKGRLTKKLVLHSQFCQNLPRAWSFELTQVYLALLGTAVCCLNVAALFFFYIFFLFSCRQRLRATPPASFWLMPLTVRCIELGHTLCMRQHGAAWGRMGLHGVAWGCMRSHGAAWHEDA